MDTASEFFLTWNKMCIKEKKNFQPVYHIYELLCQRKHGIILIFSVNPTSPCYSLFIHLWIESWHLDISASDWLNIIQGFSTDWILDFLLPLITCLSSYPKTCFWVLNYHETTGEEGGVVIKTIELYCCVGSACLFQ